MTDEPLENYELHADEDIVKWLQGKVGELLAQISNNIENKREEEHVAYLGHALGNILANMALCLGRNRTNLMFICLQHALVKSYFNELLRLSRFGAKMERGKNCECCGQRDDCSIKNE